MNKKLAQRFNELKNQYLEIEQTKKHVSGAFGSTDTIDIDALTSWKVKVKNLLVTVCGEQSQHFIAFIKGEESSYSLESQYSILTRLGAIFDAAKEDFEGGYLNTLKQLVQAEVFESELEQAEELLASGYKIAAAVIAGVVLETALRDLCTENDIAHASLNAMNTQLTKQGVFNKLQQKQVTALADIRNSAAHGNPDQFTEQDVKNMIRDIETFLLNHMA
ncbi:DUF4145 domain-containing protein [Vibrio vulnificus]|uniref:DUF4145 domain-containing protein n=1 Tax=Vibrio vulnificus TaxID=672 RepID=UPI00102A622C|nr:DUF4145 domain-containing protein [Vibrio vulnificus]EGQ8503932.1 DUF4145 domain-containing protein [Vibrio parahaemolyticus]EJG1862081.1 DUF4145 domain-containing protein [Vibrio parahaemolyticus]EJG2002846.1 DUF4145 domain-containing protein [Vibrio parahaemolyticus]EJG2040285.1 DUF4145 domain-containing protein [Vibrio parahaemolyticus]EJG2044939.1 DUF4145 domain-containing protein [Vibrio parahaemolyticus]